MKQKRHLRLDLRTEWPLKQSHVAHAWLVPADFCLPERRVGFALAKGPKTLQEIERWGHFNGSSERLRQQAVCRCLHRLMGKGVVEATSRKRMTGSGPGPCTIYRLTRIGEVIWGSET